MKRRCLFIGFIFVFCENIDILLAKKMVACSRTAQAVSER